MMGSPFLSTSKCQWTALLVIASCYVGTLLGVSEGRHHHYFAVEGDYVLLRRANSHGKTLVVTPGGSAAITSGNLIHKMTFEPGFSAALKAFYGVHSTWELRYMGRFRWEGRKTVMSTQDFSLPNNDNPDGINSALLTSARAVYDSDMYTGEINYWRHASPRYIDFFSVSWLMGLRFFNIKEKINVLFGIGQRGLLYQVNTKSRSLGPQAGFSLEYNPYRFFTWGGVIKVGALFNRGRQTTGLFGATRNNAFLDQAVSGSNFAYTAQVYGFTEWRPTKFFTITFNYQVLYVGAVIVADSQLFFQEGGIKLSSNGNIIYHGATAGIQFNF